MLKIIAALAVVSALAAPAWAEDSKVTRTIQLSGHGEVRQAPDLAVISTGVLTSAPDAKAALAANTKAMSTLLATIKTAGVEDKDVQTSNFSVQPQYDYGQNNNGQPPKLTGYQVSNMVTVTLRKIDSVGDVLDKMVSAGSNQVSGISFSIADPQGALDEARKAAMADALHKATVLSAAAGVKLGSIVSLSEGGGTVQPPIVMMRAKTAAMDAAPVPMAEGEQIVGADINVVWTIE